MKIKRLFLAVLLATVSAVLMNGCTDDKPTDPAVVAPKVMSSFELIQTRILDKTCATSGCHASDKDASFKQHGLVLAASVAYDNLVNKDPMNTNALSDKLKRVLPFNAEQSFLFHKLNWNGAGHHNAKDYGNPMPLGRTALSIGQIEFVRRWIEAGALKTGSVVDTTLLADKTPSYVEKSVELEKPASGTGFQLMLNSFEVAPNFERELFQRQSTYNSEDLYINRVAIKMRTGSHHFILYQFRDPKAVYMPPFNDIRDIRNPDGTNNLSTILSMSNHVFWAGAGSPTYDYTLPAGAALILPAGSSLDLNSHYVNKTNQPIVGEVKANLYTIPKSQVKNVVYALDLPNNNLNLPAGQETTVTKTFDFTKRTKVLMLTSHNHKLGTKFVIKISGGARNGEVVYESSDWEHPVIKNFDTPITLEKGQGLTSVITYKNTTTKAVKFGLTSDDEMGIIFGYYYEE